MASTIWLTFCAVSPERERGDLVGLGVGVAAAVGESAAGAVAVVADDSVAGGEGIAGVLEGVVSAVCPSSW